MQQHNVLSGIIIFDAISFASFIVNPMFFLFPGDMDLLIGGFIGTWFSTRVFNQSQRYIKVGISVGLLGGILSAMSMFLYTLFAYLIPGTIQIANVLYMYLFLGISVGTALGWLFGWYYKRANA